MNLRKNDKVVVLSGDSAGTQSRVLKVLPKTDRVIVEKVNFVKRHRKPRSQQQVQSGIIEKEAPIHASNVALWCDRCSRGVRIKITGTGKGRARICATCGSVIA